MQADTENEIDKIKAESSTMVQASEQKAITLIESAKSESTALVQAANKQIDKAESETELANAINHLAVEEMAKFCKQQNKTMLHVSTDYVFNGENHKPYIETDATDPLGVYGVTKLNGELAMQQISPVGAIVRTSWVYSEFGNNFVKTMLRLGSEKESLNVIFDQIGTPTYATDLAKALINILNSDALMLERKNNELIQNSELSLLFKNQIMIYRQGNIKKGTNEKK